MSRGLPKYDIPHIFSETFNSICREGVFWRKHFKQNAKKNVIVREDLFFIKYFHQHKRKKRKFHERGKRKIHKNRKRLLAIILKAIHELKATRSDELYNKFGTIRQRRNERAILLIVILANLK